MCQAGPGGVASEARLGGITSSEARHKDFLKMNISFQVTKNTSLLYNVRDLFLSTIYSCMIRGGLACRWCFTRRILRCITHLTFCKSFQPIDSKRHVPKIIDPVFAKTSPNTGSINSGNGDWRNRSIIALL